MLAAGTNSDVQSKGFFLRTCPAESLEKANVVCGSLAGSDESAGLVSARVFYP